MSIYEQNIKTLAKYYPNMDVLIEESQSRLQPTLEVEEEFALDGTRLVKIKKEQRTCYLNGKRDPNEPAEIWVESLGKLPVNATVFMFGLGNSKYLEKLIESSEKRLSIIVYEPSLEIFIDFLEHQELERWMEKHLIIFWVDGIEGMEIQNIAPLVDGLITYEMLPYFRSLVLPNYDVLFPEQAVEFLKLCRKRASDEIVRRNTNNIFSDVMVKNLLANAVYLLDGYKTTQLVQVIPRDIPGIVVAAGPSLNKNLLDLKEAKGKALIIAVDTAVKPLLKNGIKPDMIMIIDAIKPVELFEVEGVKDIPLVTTLNAASEVLKYHTGKKIFYDEGYQFAERILIRSHEMIGDLASGGSVATNAFSLLQKIGLTRIILVGQDLAYTNNRTHADGTFQERMDEVDTKGMYMVEGNYEEKVPVAGDLRQFLEWYNYAIEEIQKLKPQFRVINATEGGAKIKNTEIMTLKEAVRQECTKKVDIRACLDQLSPMLGEAEREWSKNFLKSIPKACQGMSRQAKRIKKLYTRLDQVCKKKNIDKAEYLSVLKKIEKNVKEIENTDMYQLASITLSEANYIISSEQFFYENSMAAEGKEIARKGILYMGMVDECGRIFQQYAEEIYKDI